jgi:thymidylate synthase (FAD)
MSDVLDHGEVVLVDHMAGDHKVYGAARVSTGKRPEDASKGEAADRGLIAYLMRNGHGTPFEHATFQWFIKAPIFVAREWQRHRMASYNEQSGRYMEFEPEFYVPDHLREPDPANRQSACRSEATGSPILPELRTSMVRDFEMYRFLLDRGVAREMARMVLPVSTYTRFWFTVNARSLMNFLALRNAPAAQWEIQQYAEALEADFAQIMPWTHAAFVANGRTAP